jgi:hypothetical protein
MGIGLGLLIAGVAMDVSVYTGHGRVVNLGLASERLMWILIGGFSFLGGIVLYAVHHVTRGKYADSAERTRGAKQGMRWARVVEVWRSIPGKVANDFLLVRFAHGVGVAFLLTTLVPIAATLFYWLVYACALGLTLRQVSHHKAISQAWLAGAIALLCVVAFVLMQGVFYRDLDYLMPMSAGEVMGTLILLVPAGVFYGVSRRYATR